MGYRPADMIEKAAKYRERPANPSPSRVLWGAVLGGRLNITGRGITGSL